MRAKISLGPVLTAFLSIAVLTAMTSGYEMESLRKSLESEIRAAGVEVSLAFKDLETGRTLFIRETDRVHAASTMKVAVMIEVFKQAGEGKFSLDDRLIVRNEFPSLADGSPFSLSKDDDSDPGIYDLVGTEMSIRELTERMITVSSNLATNLLIDLVRAKEVMVTLGDLGIRGMKVLRGVEDGKAFERGLNNETDALSLMLVMEAIAAGTAGSETACREMAGILARQKFRDGIPAGLPPDVPAANKTGSITGIEHDAAIVFPPGRKPYVLAVLSRGVKSSQEGESLIARLSRIVFREVAGEGPGG
jgi:beta-lactamase class A